MTDTRKKIIELIEPWMDKTLSEGCSIIGVDSDGNEVYFRLINSENHYITKDDFDGLDVGMNFENYWQVDDGGDGIQVIKVLGHYDITAVFKAIELNEKKYCPPSGDTYPYSRIVHFQKEYIIVGICDILYDTIDGKELRFESKYKIPNKPLSLYIEEEDKALLELLQKLGN